MKKSIFLYSLKPAFSDICMFHMPLIKEYSKFQLHLWWINIKAPGLWQDPITLQILISFTAMIVQCCSNKGSETILSL